MDLAFGRCRDINGPLMEAALALYRSSFPAHELRLPPYQRAIPFITLICACWMARLRA